MRRFLFLICCIASLTAPFCGAQSTESDTEDSPDDVENSEVDSTPMSQTTMSSTYNNITNATEADKVMTTSILPRRVSTTLLPKTPTKTPSTGPKLTTTTSPSSLLFKMECFPVFLVSGGLIILSFILLLSTLMLAWRVCRQNSRIKELTATEYWMETSKKDKNKSETSPNETTLMLTDLSETKGEVGNGTAKEEVEDAEKTEENTKEDGDTEKSEEAAATPEIVSETSPSPKPQEEDNETKATSSDTSSAAVPSSDGTEEPKEVV